MFQSSFQVENYFSQVIFKSEVCKGFLTLFYHKSAVQSLTVLWYLQWRVQPCPECSTVFLVLLAEVLLVFDVLFLKQVLFIFYLDVT